MGNMPPVLDRLESDEITTIHSTLQARLNGLIDLALTLKHVHWNVVGPNFISVHEMLDDHVDQVRDMSDAVAERLRTMGGEPIGTPQHLVSSRDWDDYPVGKGDVSEHLNALDSVYTGVIGDHRDAIESSAPDPVTEDLFVGQTATLELLQWFVRSHVPSFNSAD